MSTINSGQFAELCNGVWRDRASILTTRGVLSGEATLVRAVYWRLCNSGVKPAQGPENYGSTPTILTYQSIIGRMLDGTGQPAFDSAPILKGLVERYQNEIDPKASG